MPKRPFLSRRFVPLSRFMGLGGVLLALELFEFALDFLFRQQHGQLVCKASWR